MARIHHATLAKAKKFNITLTVEENDVVATGKDGTRLASGLQGNKVLEDAITKQTGHAAKSSGPTGAEKNRAKKAVTPEETACRELGWKKSGKTFTNEEGDVADADTWEELHAELIANGEIEDEEELEPHSEEEAERDNDEEEATESRSIVKAKYKAAYKPHKAKNGDEIGKQLTAHVSREDSETGEMRIQLSLLKKFAKANDCWVESYSSLKNRDGGWNAGQARMNVGNRLRAKMRKDDSFEIQWV